MLFLIEPMSQWASQQLTEHVSAFEWKTTRAEATFMFHVIFGAISVHAAHVSDHDAW